MKISYALIAACLSLQACNDPAPTAAFDTRADFYVDEYNVGAVTPPAAKAASIEEQYAIYWIDTTGADRTAAVSPAIEPTDDYAIDWSIDTDDHTATVISPASKPSEDKSVTTGTEFYLDDDGFSLMLPAPIDLHAIQATDWW
jgi:hypothetical protein